jgi:putative ABC transport system permease protein
MKVTNLVRVASRSMLRNKMRTLLTMLGVIIGVASVTVMVAIGHGAQAQIQERIDSLGTNLIVLTPGSASQGGVHRGAGSFNRLTVEDAEMLRRDATLLSAVSPVVFAYGQAIGGQGNWRTGIQGVHTDFATIRDWSTSSGAFFDQNDMRAMRKVALLGQTVADQLFPGADPVGQSIQLRDVPFRIVGVLARKGQMADGTDQDDVILAPYTTVRARLSGRQFVGQILAATSSPADVPDAQEEIRTLMREAHRLADWEEDDFTVRNQTEIGETARGATEVMTLLLAAIAGISLVVGGIGIMNIMLVSVTERTREIGIRMALGARGSDVLIQFLVESVVMSIAGGLIGSVVGWAGAGMLARTTGWAVTIPPETLMLALGFSATVGVFFGFWPARKAAALDPIEALRYE